MKTQKNTPSIYHAFNKYKLHGLAFLFIFLNSFISLSQSLPQTDDKYIYFSNGDKVDRLPDTPLLHVIHYSLDIYLDKKGEMSFEEILENKHLFQANNTYDNLDTDATYWATTEVQARKSHQDSIIFLFKDYHSLKSWDRIDAYLIHEDGTIEHQQAGAAVSKDKKISNFPFDPIAFGLAPNEKATLFFRVEKYRVSPETHYYKNILSQERWADRLTIVLMIKDLQELLQPYQFNGTYHQANYRRPFVGNYIRQFQLYQDRSYNADISYIYKNQASLPWGLSDEVVPELGEVYWMKTRLIGSDRFNG